MSDFALLKTLEEQSIENYSDPQPTAQGGAAQTTTPPVTPGHLDVAAPAISSAPQPTARLASPTAQVQTLAVQQPVQKFSMYSEPWQIAEMEKAIPGYQLADSCATCVYSNWNEVKMQATCAYHQSPIITCYICPQYMHPEELMGQEEEAPETLSEPTPPPPVQPNPPTPIALQFSDAALHQQAIQEGKQKFGDKLTPEAMALWVTRCYARLYEGKYGQLPA